MKFVDTHAHLYAEEFDTDRRQMIERAIEAGVTQLYLPNIDSNSIDIMLELEAAFPAHCIAMMGLHPCYVKENYEAELALVKQYLDSRPFAAVGEIGIDLHWDKSTLEIQKIAFRQQIKWAKELNIPIVIHARKAMHEILPIIKQEKDDRLSGIFHAFSGSAIEAKEIMELGFLMGIGGVMTYKNAGLAEIVKTIPLEYFVLETDAPYLTPVPHRGKRNESAYIPIIAQALADAKGVSLEAVAAQTTQNAEKLFAKYLVGKTHSL
jgi:TatD DNase family protein